MSITNTNNGTSVRNPATAILEWDAMEGNFKYYDSEAKERAFLKGKIEFIVLDQLSNVSGWVQDLGGCKAQETHNLSKAPLKVQAWKDGKPTLVKEGMYKDIKDSLKAMGIKYRKVVYALTTECETFGAGTIIKLDLGGCAMSQWIEDEIKDGKQVALAGAEQVQLNKMVSYMKPQFSVVEPDTADLLEAKDADVQLQAYFDARKQKESAPAVQQTTLDSEVEYESDIPF